MERQINRQNSKRKGWWRRYLERLGKINDEQYHGKRPRCCDPS